jgi:hypothetical protein
LVVCGIEAGRLNFNLNVALYSHGDDEFLGAVLLIEPALVSNPQGAVVCV